MNHEPSIFRSDSKHLKLHDLLIETALVVDADRARCHFIDAPLLRDKVQGDGSNKVDKQQAYTEVFLDEALEEILDIFRRQGLLPQSRFVPEREANDGSVKPLTVPASWEEMGKCCEVVADGVDVLMVERNTNTTCLAKGPQRVEYQKVFTRKDLEVVGDLGGR
jgi:hypothetical protein